VTLISVYREGVARVLAYYSRSHKPSVSIKGMHRAAGGNSSAYRDAVISAILSTGLAKPMGEHRFKLPVRDINAALQDAAQNGTVNPTYNAPACVQSPDARPPQYAKKPSAFTAFTAEFTPPLSGTFTAGFKTTRTPRSDSANPSKRRRKSERNTQKEASKGRTAMKTSL
jgi:hypothetical protein